MLRQATLDDPAEFDRAMAELRRVIELQIWSRLPPEERAAVFAAREAGGLPVEGPGSRD